MPQTLEFFRAVFEASPNPYALLNRDLRFVAVNPAYAQVTGASQAAVLGRRPEELTPAAEGHPDAPTLRRVLDSMRRVLETCARDVLPLVAYGDRLWSTTHSPIKAPDGSVAYVLQHTVDVTEVERPAAADANAEAALARAERMQARNVALGSSLRRLEEVFAQAPGFMCYLRAPHYTFELANDAYKHLVGRETLLGLRIKDALPEIGEQGFVKLLQQVVEEGRPYVGKAQRALLRRGPDGPLEEFFVDFVFQPIFGPDGVADGVLVQGHDITAEHRARAEAQRALAQLEAILESFPEPLFVGDAGGIKRVNRAALNLVGAEHEGELLGEHARAVQWVRPRRVDTGEALGPSETPFGKAVRGQRSDEELVIYNARLGEDRVIRASGAPIIEEGRVTGGVVSYRDVTEQREMEDSLVRLARVLDETRDFVGISDLEGRPLYINDAGCALLGVRREDLPQKQLLDAFAERDRERVTREVLPSALRDGHWEGALTFRHLVTGEEIPVLYSVFTLKDARGTVNALATITRDLRAQKAHERERQALLEAEQAARSQAERASRIKDDFLATVSHELRTPLTSMLGWIQMLKAGRVAESKRQRALETVERATRAQAQLIEDLLDVSRILSGKLNLERAPLDLGAVLASAVETVRPQAEGKGVALEVAVDEAMVTGDAQRLQQVVWNLLSNAVKFTPPGGKVTLTLERDERTVAFRVSDTGEGIAEDLLPHVFDRFRQGEVGIGRRTGGLGLGLSIARHLVEVHGGEVTAQSGGVGKGSTFVVRLPLLRGVRGYGGRDGAGRMGEAQALRGLHVLVVDDEDDTREFLRMLLEGHGAKVTEARTAGSALSVLGSVKVDVLLSDIGMPGEDGYQLIAKVRALPPEQGGRVPAVALTAYARMEDRARALQAGFEGHVTKPVRAQELIAALCKVAEQSSLDLRERA